MDETLYKKLFLGKFAKKAILRCPDDFLAFDGLDYDSEMDNSKYDMILVFVFSLGEFTTFLNDIIESDRLNEGGIVYFAYPKKGNKRYHSYIGRDDFFTVVNMDDGGYVGQSSIKFNRMVALDQVFTIIGLQRISVRKNSSTVSQRISDYSDELPHLKALLRSHPEAFRLFEELTPGYQRGWARYVYAVRSTDTKQRHFENMLMALKSGCKTIEDYRKIMTE